MKRLAVTARCDKVSELGSEDAQDSYIEIVGFRDHRVDHVVDASKS
jgi:hypothetical protein